GYVNMVNNYFKAGPGTKNKTRLTQMSAASSDNSSGTPSYMVGMYSRYFIQGNYMTAAGNSAANYDWKGVVSDGGKGQNQTFTDKNNLFGLGANASVPVKLTEAIPMEGAVTTQDAETAFAKVLAYAGASLYRDAVDARFMEEARTGTATYKGTEQKTGDGKTSGNYNRPGIIDKINNPDGTQNSALPSFPEFESTSRPDGFDTDKDGMPDEWETLNGLDPMMPSDGKTKTLDAEKGWYTNLEVYMNSLVEHIVKGGNEAAIEAVDEYYPKYVNADGVQNSLEEVMNPQEIISIDYYSLDGKPLAEPVEGISIRRITYRGGKVYSDLVKKN
ncbi:MAG: pectate lyase, partial [Bacteroidales bacterium]|nr:pectate lyase [Bacteroidales bacterium]